MLKANNVSHRVPVAGGVLEILKGVGLDINAGESVAIIGASGSGKSTLLAMLAGLDVPSAGEVSLAGQDITLLDEEARSRLRAEYVAFVFQDFQLLPSLTALENVMLPLEVRIQSASQGIKSNSDIKTKAQRYLERVGLAERLTHYPKQLSGGEQQRVALARAFACEAPILFADEPTGNLDADTGKDIEALLFDMNKEAQTTLVLVTHDEGLAARCERQFLMRAGQLSESSAHQTDQAL